MTIAWLPTPLFSNAGGWSATVGVDEDRAWYLRHDELLLAGSSQAAMLLLPVLQDGFGGSLAEVRSRIRAGLGALGRSTELEQSFPYSAPVLLAFTSMPRWARWAVRWLPELELSEEQARAILVACEDRSIEQGVRHLALRCVHDWERQHGVCLLRLR